MLEFPDRKPNHQRVKVAFTRYFPQELRDDTEIRIRQALAHFPELVGDEYKELKVGYTRAYGGNAIEGDYYIRLKERASHNTVAHELMHHVQFAGQIPGGEKACDLYTLARDLSFCDRPPCYLHLPLMVKVEWDSWKVIAHEMAVESLRRRDVGLRTYIQWFEHTMECMFVGDLVPIDTITEAIPKKDAVDWLVEQGVPPEVLG